MVGRVVVDRRRHDGHPGRGFPGGTAGTGEGVPPGRALRLTGAAGGTPAVPPRAGWTDPRPLLSLLADRSGAPRPDCPASPSAAPAGPHCVSRTPASTIPSSVPRIQNAGLWLRKGGTAIPPRRYPGGLRGAGRRDAPTRTRTASTWSCG